MITLYNKDYTTKYGTINSVIEAFVEEERNGLFELSFIMLNTDNLFQYIKEDNIVVANANNTLINQKFRIYMTRKLMNNRIEVFARHISFDLMYDYVDNVSFENQSCEYGLNQLFRQSQFSSHYKGYSDIINAQNYSMSMANVLEAIGGKRGSLLDTFGTGAELLRDNENIYILNKRGYDNEVSIEYKKNLTGFELEEDTTELVTRILPYAKYTPTDEEGNSLEEITVKGSFVDSPLIANYSHPFVKAIDYTERFEEDEIPTVSKLTTLAQNEYKVNKADILKQNFKIEFIPLSKCIGYEGLEDNISLCDIVTVKDTRYNIDTQAKVIKVVYNVLKNRYESMELGEPKTSLGDIIGNNDSIKGEKGDKGDKGDKGEDGNIGDFPDSLPSTPVVTTKVYGFANIEISWTFESKVYYQYEVYASKEANFTPNSFNLIHKGQTSTYMYQAKPNETWYFKVCATNTHNNRTDFGVGYATTVKIDDLSNYVEEMAINEALIGTLNLGRGWVGELQGNYINAKQLSVTDGNGKRTLDIDSFGNINLDVASLKISSSDVATEDYTDTQIENQVSSVKTSISKVEQTANKINWLVASGTSSSNMSLTSEALNIISSNINLSGYVTFNSLSSPGATTINGNNITSGTIKGVTIISTNNNKRRVEMVEDGLCFYSDTKQAGVVHFDSNGEGTASSATDRFLIKSLNGYALKMLSTGDVSIEANSGSRKIYLTSSSVNASKDLGVGGELKCEGVGRFYNGISSDGNITTTSNITANGSLTVSTSTVLKGTLNVTGTTTLGTLSTTGATTLKNSLSVTGTTTLSSSLNVTGAGKFLSNVSVSGILYGMGNITLNNASTYFPAVSTTTSADRLRLGNVFISAPTTSVHLITSSSGNASLYGGAFYANSYNNLSDARAKTDIKRINQDNMTIDDKSIDLTTEDMLEFIENLPMVSYRLNEEVEQGKDSVHYGFLMQEIMDSKVGEKLVAIPNEEHNDNTYIRYSLNNLVSFLCGALQEEIKERKALEAIVNELKTIKEFINYGYSNRYK